MNQSKKPTASELAAARKVAEHWGKQGGKKRAANMTKAERSAAARKAVKARWRNRGLDKA